MEDSLSTVAAERDLVVAHPSGEHRLQTEDGQKRCLLVGPEVVLSTMKLNWRSRWVRRLHILATAF